MILLDIQWTTVLASISPIILLAISLYGTYKTQLRVKEKERKIDYHKLQIERTQQLFILLTDLNFENASLFNSGNQFTHDRLLERAKSWIKSFLKFRRFFLENQILFPKSLNAKIQPKLEQLRQLALEVKAIKDILADNEYMAGGDLNNIYHSVEEETAESTKILTRIQRKESYVEVKQSIEKILTDIEIAFRSLIV